MRKYVSIILSVVVVAIAGYIVAEKKDQHRIPPVQVNTLGIFDKSGSCARPPQFLKRFNILRPVMIDLSQKRFKGIALLYGEKFHHVLHPKQWERYGYFSTYALDERGTVYLVPMPFISIYPDTFNLQKNIYRVNTKTGKLSLFMHLNDVHPSLGNPYGLTAIAYDCADHTLWVSAIDESDYQNQKGVIYHIDPQKKEILQKVKGVDALSLTLLKSDHGKFLLIGSARDNGLYAYSIQKGVLSDHGQKLLSLPALNEHIRKIKVSGRNRLELQAIPFGYTLVAQSGKKDRTYYQAEWNQKTKSWKMVSH